MSKETIYGRVDVFYDNDNLLSLGELELIEPELWFRKHPPVLINSQMQYLCKYNII